MGIVKRDLSFSDFSSEIIKTGDIDPDYIFLKNHLDKFGRDETIELFKKKLLIYNLESELLYHTGQITKEELKFGAERRKQKQHFPKWERKLQQIDFDKVMKTFDGADYLVFREYFITLDGMGNWASWKAADIMNKVFGVKFHFDEMTFLNAYEYPLKGLLMINNEVEDIKIYRDMELFKGHIKQAFNMSKNVPNGFFFDTTDLLTLETCLCKYHSYKHGKYTIGEDLHRVMEINNNDKLKKYWGLI